MENLNSKNMHVKQLMFLIAVILSLLLILALLFYGEAEAQESRYQYLVYVYDSVFHGQRDCDSRLRARAERRYLRHREHEYVYRREGDYELENDVTLDGHLVVTEGDAILAGRVTGSVLVLCGDVVVRSTGRVDGDVICIGGEISRFKGGRIYGDQVEASLSSLSPRRYSRLERRRRWRKYHRRWTKSFRGKLHYNRVDGPFLGAMIPRTYDSDMSLDVFGFGGYGFKGKRWQYQIGGEFYTGTSARFIAGAEGHNFTDTEDAWIIPEEENSLAALLINEDFRDYYRRDGYSLFAGLHANDNLKLSAGYRRDNLSTLTNQTDWSLFVNNKRFRPNPAADEAKLVGYFGHLSFDTRNNGTHPRRGWYLDLQAEFNRPEFGSEFDFDRVIVDLRRYQPIGYGKNLDFRLRAGSARGALPEQFLFDLGGLSTLRGHRFKEFTGDRMVLGNLEYRVSAGKSRLRDVPLLGELNMILFADAGWVWTAEENSRLDESFEALTADKLKFDYGIALTDSDGRVRLNFARRTDTGTGDIVVTFRLNRAF